ncbi:alpha-2-macroglobulin-like [Protopterus annectens]|uniref:alpha-2-macroglobulin-like n=1 Tax=Protopterus annectens TaxID=7888 RepID=UPI001CFA89E4|nr:alpha-2-macroglobulin-like [Protopterus annectens]
MWRGILFSCLLFHLTTAAPKPQFLVVFPNMITIGTDTNVCFHFINLLEDIIFQSTLLTINTRINLLSERVHGDPNWYKCINLKDKLQGQTLPGLSILEAFGVSNTYSFHKAKKVFLLLPPHESSTFIQTDKPIYKPGQTVKFRIVTLNEDFIPDLSEISAVYIQDPQQNRIIQWLNVKTQQGIGDLSFPLAQEVLLGTYKIIAQKHEALTTHTFSVEEYVLPTFEAQLKLPHAISFIDKEFEVKVCSSYTYGKPVRGTVHISLCRQSQFLWSKLNSFEMTDEYCKEFNGSTDGKGCFSKVFATYHFHLRTPIFNMEIKAHARITEEGTDREAVTTGTILIKAATIKMNFEDLQEHYKPGMPFSGKVKVEDIRGSPKVDKNITLCIDSTTCETLTTDFKGYVYFSYNTTTWKGETVQLSAKPQLTYSYGDSFRVLNPLDEMIFQYIFLQYSKSNSYLSINSVNTSRNNCDVLLEMQVSYTFNTNAMEGKRHGLDFFYLVTANRNIVVAGRKSTEAGREGHLTGTVSFKIPIKADVSQNAEVLVYAILPSGDVAVDRKKLQISKCFSHQIKLQFPESEVLPGSHTELHVKAAPGSLCAVKAIDESVLLLKLEEEITVDKVYTMAKRDQSFLASFISSTAEVEMAPCKQFQPTGSYWHQNHLGAVPVFPITNFVNDDSYAFFFKVGLNFLTDISMRKPVDCYPYATPGLSMPFRAPEGVGIAFPVAGTGFAPGVGAAAIPGAGAVGIPGALAGVLPGVGAGVGAVVPGSFAPHSAADLPSFPVLQQVSPLMTTIRKHFPETWIWELAPVSLSGEVKIPLTVPDTITKWKTEMFCMASLGFGLAETVTLNVFQPFFVEPALPYSVIRGEAFTLKATVFNHLTQCIMVEVTLEKSKDFLVKYCENCQYTSCICGSESKTFLWDINPKSLGEVNFTISAEAIHSDEYCGNEIVTVPQRGQKDIVIRPLLVQPEGTLIEMAKSSLLCPKGTAQLEDINLLIPNAAIEGSVKAHISVTGDILGSALQNIDKLLAMPFGCGEQNMVLFAPNIYILQYLEKTDQLTTKIKDKAIEFLKRGYQGQLKYQHTDGSYSTFGISDPEGNTWLTAFVLKSFFQAKPYIFVEDTQLQKTLKWIEQQQLPNGCFRNVGRLLLSSMKGGVNDDISLSAYITTALLEIQLPLDSVTVARSLRCLESALSNVTNPYTLALLAYTYTLARARNEMIREAILKRLDSLAIKEDEMIHWERAEKPSENQNNFFWNRAPSAEVEMTAYVLLALVSSQNPSTTDLSYATKIVKWITKQQGPYGGFSSTQDTVVALHALSKYAALMYSKKSNVTVNVKSGQQLTNSFKVNKSNSLLLQSMTITDTSRNYTAEIFGEGCILIQTTLKYNVPPEKNELTFSIQVNTAPAEGTQLSSTTFKIIINASYTGKRRVSNMAIIDVKMLSGYVPDKISVRKLEMNNLVKRTEVKITEVIIYLEELSHNTVILDFNVKQDFPVKNTKPAVVKIYDYYETDEHAITEYNVPSSLADSKEENNAR